MSGLVRRVGGEAKDAEALEVGAVLARILLSVSVVRGTYPHAVGRRWVGGMLVGNMSTDEIYPCACPDDSTGGYWGYQR